MNTRQTLTLLACAAIIGGCATVTPHELEEARIAYQRASNGEAAVAAPVELHAAHSALLTAEAAFAENPRDETTRDLAYVAQRKAEMAEAQAVITRQQKSQEKSQAEYTATQGAMIAKGAEDLAASERRTDSVTDKLAAEKAARMAAELKTAQALAALAVVTEEARGMVLTISGSVLFGSNESVLLPAAETRLNQVADVLLLNADRKLVVQGHTDSQGSDAYNQTLSQARADQILALFVAKGYPANLMTAVGMGEAKPVATNDNVDGRANNRRVEIVIEPKDDADQTNQNGMGNMQNMQHNQTSKP